VGHYSRPAHFGQFSNDLLIGNFSYTASEINAFDPTTGKFEGTIPVNPGMGQTPGGPWFLGFGTGGSNGSRTPSSSPMVSMARHTACLAPYQMFPPPPRPSLVPCQAW
jgi:hypothetical protein